MAGCYQNGPSEADDDWALPTHRSRQNGSMSMLTVS